MAMHERSGYGVAARRLAIALRHEGVPLSYVPMIGGKVSDLWYQPFNGRSIGEPDLDPICNLPIEYDTNVVFMVPEYLVRFRTEEPDRTLVACTVWETDRLPHHWAVGLEMADHIVVPCTWNQRVFEQRGLTPRVSVLPHVARDGREAPRRKDWGVPTDDFVFYCIEVWSDRKALSELLHTYLRTFTAKDPVTLILKTTAKDFTRQNWFGFRSRTIDVVKRIARFYPNPARVRVITESLSEDDMILLHGRGDCYVSLSRGEGWNLGAFDAATFGKPVIMTGFGGPLDYLPPEHSYLLDYEMTPVQCDAGKPSFTDDQLWAKASTDHASARMREVFENREEAKRRGAALREMILAQFNERAVVARFTQILDAL